MSDSQGIMERRRKLDHPLDRNAAVLINPQMEPAAPIFGQVPREIEGEEPHEDHFAGARGCNGGEDQKGDS